MEKKKPSLLEQAKAINLYPARYVRENARHSQYDVEVLALAYVKGEVSYIQACKATGYSGSSLYSLMMPAIKRIWAEGALKQVKPIKNK